eukprot:403356113
MNSMKGSAILSGATTKASYLIQSSSNAKMSTNLNSLKGTIIGFNDLQFSGGSSSQATPAQRIIQQRLTAQKNQRHFLSGNKQQFDILNRERFQKTIFKTVCDMKKDIDISEGPIKETTSFDYDSLDDISENCNQRDIQDTIKKSFTSCINPHQLKRKDQLANDYVWYAAYDEDLLNNQMLQKILNCSDSTYPLEYQSLKVDSFEVIFLEPKFAYLQKKHVKLFFWLSNILQNSHVLIKAFLVSFQQLVDICVIKNKQFIEVEEQYEDNVVVTQSSDQDLFEVQFQDLGRSVFYDMIFSLGKFDGLPIYAISNKEKSYIYGRPSMQPSFLKHIGTNQMDLQYISYIFKGLTESFPQFSVDYLLFYLYSKSGINQKLTVEELTTVRILGSQESNRQSLAKKQYNRPGSKNFNQQKEQQTSQYDYDYYDMDHSLMKNKRPSFEKYTTSNKNSRKKIQVHNILNSLTKQEIEDPFQSNKFQSSRRNHNGFFNQSQQSNGVRIFRSFQKQSPMTISSYDQGGVCVINRQEEDLIKKIDFKQELLDSLENDLSPGKNIYELENNNVRVNISHLIDENVSQASSSLKFPVFLDDFKYEILQDNENISKPSQINKFQDQTAKSKKSGSSSLKTISITNPYSSKKLEVRQVKRVPLKDIKNTVMNSLINKGPNQIVSSHPKQKQQFKLTSNDSSQNMSPIGKRKSFGEQSYGTLQVEEYSNISDISYSGCNQILLQSNQKKKIIIQQNQQKQNHQQKSSSKKNFSNIGPGFRLQTQISQGGSYIGHSNSKNSLLQFKDINKENNIKLFTDRNKTAKNRQMTVTRANLQTQLSKKHPLQPSHSGYQQVLSSAQKTDTFINEIRSLLDNLSSRNDNQKLPRA